MEYAEFKKTVARKRKLISKQQKELSELLKSCPHEEMIDKSMYFEGGYLNTAYTEYWKECPICGYRTERQVKDHGWYA